MVARVRRVEVEREERSSLEWDWEKTEGMRRKRAREGRWGAFMVQILAGGVEGGRMAGKMEGQRNSPRRHFTLRERHLGRSENQE